MAPTDVERTALVTLDDDDRTPTARVFAVGRELSSTEVTMQDALTAFAAWRARHFFTVPPAVEASLQRLCTAAREQGHDVDHAAACEAAVPAEEREVLSRARSIRSADALAVAERQRRLEAFLSAAREAGYDVTERDLDTDDRYGPPERTVTDDADSTDTAGCESVEDPVTSGCRISSRSYSRQHEPGPSSAATDDRAGSDPETAGERLVPDDPVSPASLEAALCRAGQNVVEGRDGTSIDWGDADGSDCSR